MSNGSSAYEDFADAINTLGYIANITGTTVVFISAGDAHKEYLFCIKHRIKPEKVILVDPIYCGEVRETAVANIKRLNVVFGINVEVSTFISIEEVNAFDIPVVGINLQLSSKDREYMKERRMELSGFYVDNGGFTFVSSQYGFGLDYDWKKVKN